MQKILRQYSYLWVPFIGVILVFIPLIENGFVWDDFKAFIIYPYYRDLSYLGRAFTEPLIFWPDYYRPVTSATFILQIHYFGLDPSNLHWASIILHASNALLVGFLCRTLMDDWTHKGKRSLIPLISSLFYAYHPALIESVSWISARFDLLVTFFLLVALYADRRISHRLLRPIFVGGVFLLAALSKEMAVGLVLAIPFWHLACAGIKAGSPLKLARELHQRGDTSVYLAIAVAGLVYLAFRYSALGYVSSSIADSSPVESVLPRFMLVYISYIQYLSLILFPFGQINPIHPLVIPAGFFESANLLPVLGSIAMLGLAIFLLQRTPRLGWMMMAALLSMLPIVNVLPISRPAGSFFAEYYLTFPLVFFSFLVPAAYVSLKDSSLSSVADRFKKAIGSVYVLWLIVCIVVIRGTIPYWNNDYSLWQWAANKHPESDTAQVNLSSALAGRGDFSLALAAAERAILNNRQDPMAWAALGRAQYGIGLYSEAESALSRSISIKYENPQAWIALARVKLAQDDIPDAIAILEQVVLPNEPDNLTALLNLAIVYKKSRNAAKANLYFRKALRISADPETVAYITRELGNLESATAVIKQKK